MRITPLLTATLSALSLCASAFAAAPVVQFSDQGGAQASVEPSSALIVAAKATPAAASTVIYSNFGSSDQLYDCCTGWVVSGAQSMIGRPYSIAMSFTPTRSATLKRMRVALSLVDGTEAIRLSLHRDRDGVPGAKIKQMTATELPGIGSCCLTVSTGFGGASLVAGKTYWIVAKTVQPALSDTYVVWNMASPYTFGRIATNEGSGWYGYTSTQSAFEVLGQ